MGDAFKTVVSSRAFSGYTISLDISVSKLTKPSPQTVNPNFGGFGLGRVSVEGGVSATEEGFSGMADILYDRFPPADELRVAFLSRTGTSPKEYFLESGSFWGIILLDSGTGGRGRGRD